MAEATRIKLLRDEFGTDDEDEDEETEVQGGWHSFGEPRHHA